ncbi:Protein of unknown function, partial [Cotesia congregata]
MLDSSRGAECVDRTKKFKFSSSSLFYVPRSSYQSIGPGSNPAYTNEYFQYLSVLFCSAQEIQTSSNLKSLPPTVVAHDLNNDNDDNDNDNDDEDEDDGGCGCTQFTS